MTASNVELSQALNLPCPFLPFVSEPRTVVDHEQIDRDNILQATLHGMRHSLEKLSGSCQKASEQQLGREAMGSCERKLPGEPSGGCMSGAAAMAAAGEAAAGTAGAETAAAARAQAVEECREIAGSLPQAGGGMCDVDYALVDGNRLPKVTS